MEARSGMTLGLIGYGRFARFMHVLANRFVPQLKVRVFMRRPQPDVETVSLEEVAQCDIVALTVPISAYEATLKQIAPLLSPQSIVLDVATVKMHTSRLIREILPGQPYVSTHPMFGPEGYAKRDNDVTGLRIVITDTNLEARWIGTVSTMLRGFGFSVVEKTADEHDRDLAETLFLTHYVGQVIARGNFARTDIDTPSFGFLMDAVDAVRHDTELFRQVLRYNPYCDAVIEKFDRCEKEVKELLLHEDQQTAGLKDR